MSVRETIGAACVGTAVTLGMLGTVAVQAAGPEAVDLGSADTLVILARSGIFNSGPSAIAGDIGISPNGASFVTGFDLVPDVTGVFASSPRVDGRVFAANHQPPTPAAVSTAVGDMERAWLDASERSPADFIGLYGGDLAGRTLVPGLYRWHSGVLISAGAVTLAGGPNDVWILQIAEDLTVASQGGVTLIGGARPANVFWQVTGTTTLGTMSRMKGIVLGATQIVMASDAILLGRALAQGSVTLDSSTVLMGEGDSLLSDGFEG